MRPTRDHLLVTAHAHGKQSIVDGLVAGVDGIERLTFLTRWAWTRSPAEVLAALVRQRVTVGLPDRRCSRTFSACTPPRYT
jgi:hypothetical protein